MASSRSTRRNAGLAMLLVLMSVAMAVILSLAFLNGQVVATGMAQNVQKRARAQAIAESGLTLGLAYIESTPTWRSSMSHGTWISSHNFGGGSFSLKGEDGQDGDGNGTVDGDGDLADDQADPLTLTATGTFAGVSHTARAVVTPVPPGKRLLLVVADSSSLHVTERDARRRFLDWDYSVTAIDADASQTTFDDAVANHDLAYVTAYFSSSSLNTKLYGAPIGVVVAEGYLDGEFAYTTSDGTIVTGDTQVNVVDNSHHITESLSTGVHTIVQSPSAQLMYMNGTLSAGTTVLAERSGSSSPVLAVVDAGGELSDASVAAGRRVSLPWGGASFSTDELSVVGQDILRRSLQWAGEPALAGRIAHWDLDDTSVSTAGDSVGGFDGTLHNGVGTGQTGALLGSMAMTFDGANDHVEVAHNNVFLLDEGTVAFWFKTDSALAQGLVSKDSGGNDTGGHLSVWVDSQTIHFRLQDAGSTLYKITSNMGAVQLNTWHHVAVTFGSGGMKLFLDGTEVGSDPYTGGMGTTSGGTGNFEPMAFGVSTRSTGDLTLSGWSDPLSGALDEVYFFNRALNAAEIATLITPPGGSGQAYHVRWIDQP